MSISRIRRLLKLVPQEDLLDFVDGKGAKRLTNSNRKLLGLLLKNDDLTDEDAERILYSAHGTEKYKKLIYRFENALLEDVLIRDVDKTATTIFAQKRAKIYRKFSLIQILKDYSRDDLYVFYLNQLIKPVIKYQLDELGLLITDSLEFYYSFTHFNRNSAKKYSKLNNEFKDRLELKKKVSVYYYELAQLIIIGKNDFEESEVSKYEPVIENLQSLIYDDQSDIIIQRVFSCYYFFYLLKKDYKSLIVFSRDSLQFVQKNSPQNILQIYMNRLRMGVAYMYNKEFSLARECFEEVAQINATPGTVHWNSLYSYYFTLEMLTENYQRATDILIDLVTSTALDRLDEIWLQQWRIRSAYIHFLNKIGKVDLERIGKKRVPNFRLGKFLNEVPIYSKDKRGLNISIIISQMLILLADNKKDKLYDRVEALSKYSYRYLRNDNRLRSNSFIHMILSLVKADFNSIRAERYAEKYIEKLKSTEMNLNEYSADIEIIPYERLWQIILDICNPNKTNT